MKISNIFAVCAAAFLACSCATNSEYSVSSMQNKDKWMGCREIQLEINEAEFLKKQANKSKRLGVTDVVNPLGYVSEYSSAGDAADKAQTRIEYLQKIYEINACHQKEREDLFKSNSKANTKLGEQF